MADDIVHRGRGDVPDQRRTAGTRRPVLVAALTAALAFMVLVVGGYALHWRWTGLSSKVTLWDWLQVLALPIALATAPILMRHRRNMHSRHRNALRAVAIGFVGLVAAGYLIPMRWTGFTGNTLWDWLSLLLLPAVVATASVWATSWPLNRRQALISGAAALVLLAVALPGYLAPWRWTGFEGNTAWDWVKLLLLPLLVPIALQRPVTTYLAGRLDVR